MEDLRGFVLDKLRSTLQRRDSWLIEGPRVAKQTWFGENLLRILGACLRKPDAVKSPTPWVDRTVDGLRLACPFVRTTLFDWRD